MKQQKEKLATIKPVRFVLGFDHDFPEKMEGVDTCGDLISRCQNNQRKFLGC